MRNGIAAIPLKVYIISVIEIFSLKNHEGEHPMTCLIKNLLGLESLKENDSCDVLPPIVKSLVGSAIFIILMTILIHLIST